MEQTLGKRIAGNRKRLSLTQEGLAEQLGVTAQAVSKWENDQSCPDITMLPKLAEIFGISTDALLGMESKATVQTHVVEEDGEENSREQGGNWEFKWNSGRRGALTFAVLVLLVGVLTLVSRICEWDASFWSILWPSIPLVYGFSGLIRRFSFFNLGCALFGGYFLVDNLNIWEFEVGGQLIFPIIVVLLGISLLVDALRKPKKPKFRIVKRGSNSKKTKSSYTSDAHSFDCSVCFGESTQYIDIPMLQRGDISCSFGELTVDLSGCGEVFRNCQIDASCSFGQLTIRVPKRFRIEPDNSIAFGAVNIVGSPDPDPVGIICLDASASFGEVEVQYI